MANVVGYEELLVTGNAVVTATAATLRGAICAVFMVDPRALGSVRWNTPLAPTGNSGFPLYPGKWISVAGDANIRTSGFILDSSSPQSPVKVYCLYFDRVDVVAADFAPAIPVPSPNANGEPLRGIMEAILDELRDQTELMGSR